MSSRVVRRAWPALLAMILLPGFVLAESAQVVALVDRVELAYHASDLPELEATRRELLAAARRGQDRAGYYAAYARFRQALASRDNRPAARRYLDDCITELTAWTAAHPTDAESRALLGSCYGLSTSHYPLGLVSRGLEARKHLSAARALAPASPLVLLQDGLADFATPRMFGGNPGSAIAKLERAARLFSEQHAAGSAAAGWAAVETWQQLAMMYAATRQDDAAAEATARAGSLPRPGAGRLQRVSLR